MEYGIDVEAVKREIADQYYKAQVGYTFTISSGFAKTHAEVVLTEAGVNIIERRRRPRSSWRGS
jgi:hypothetical protein